MDITRISGRQLRIIVVRENIYFKSVPRTITDNYIEKMDIPKIKLKNPIIARLTSLNPRNYRRKYFFTNEVGII